MSIGLEWGDSFEEIGAASFFYAFFSTISGNLESDGWGSRFPTLMGKLYEGELDQKDATEVLRELHEAKAALSKLPPGKVIWDIEDREKAPPWGSDISTDITDLSNYFVTSDGRDLFEVLFKAIEGLRKNGGVLKIV